MRHQRYSAIQFSLALMCAFCATNLAADEKPQSEEAKSADSKNQLYLRVRRDKAKEPIALETSITRFRGQHNAQQVSVDLVGAVHVGEKEYYEELNKLFRDYDAVLYELVAPEGTRVDPQRRASGNPVSMLQTMMKSVLKLEFQLDRINYHAANMVHADMSPKEFSKSMKDRNESFLKMFLKAMQQTMAAQAKKKGGPSDTELLVALLSKDRDYRLKRLLASQFEDLDGQLAAVNGPDGSTIITERNKKALQVLRSQLGKGKKRVAIFYGAGHLSDMAERLEKDFGLRRGKQKWLEAWRIARDTPVASEADAPAESKTQAAAATGVGN